MAGVNPEAKVGADPSTNKVGSAAQAATAENGNVGMAGEGGVAPNENSAMSIWSSSNSDSDELVDPNDKDGTDQATRK